MKIQGNGGNQEAYKAHLTAVVEGKLPVTRVTVAAAKVLFKESNSSHQDKSLKDLKQKVTNFIKEGAKLSPLEFKISSIFSSIRHMFSGGSSYKLLHQELNKTPEELKADKDLESVPLIKNEAKNLSTEIKKSQACNLTTEGYHLLESSLKGLKSNINRLRESSKHNKQLSQEIRNLEKEYRKCLNLMEKVKKPLESEQDCDF